MGFYERPPAGGARSEGELCTLKTMTLPPHTPPLVWGLWWLFSSSWEANSAPLCSKTWGPRDMSCSAKDLPRDLDLPRAANYKQMLLLGPSRRPPNSRHWERGPCSLQLNSSSECQVWACMQAPLGWGGEESLTVLWSADFFLETSLGQCHVTVFFGFYSCWVLRLPVSRMDRIPQRTLRACAGGRGVHAQRPVLAAGNGSLEAHCTGASKWCDLGRVILPA